MLCYVWDKVDQYFDCQQREVKRSTGHKVKVNKGKIWGSIPEGQGNNMESI